MDINEIRVREKTMLEESDCETICRCNIKENAELIARVLDADAEGAVFIFQEVPAYPEGHHGIYN